MTKAFPPRFLAAVLATCLLLLVASAQEPSNEPQAKLYAAVATGSKRFPSDKIVAATGLKTGSSVSRADLQKAADSLSQLGLFSSVQYRFSSPPSGLSVEFVVADAPGLPILFDNFPWVTDEDLRGAIQAAVPLFDGTAPASGTILDSMGNAVDLFLERKGVFAKISYAPMTDPLTDAPVLTFLAAGPAQDVKSIEFSDPIAASDRAVQDRLPDLIGKPYSRTALELFEVEQIRPLYFTRGLLKVQFSELLTQGGAASGDALPAEVSVRVVIDPGPAYAWGGVTWKGNVAVSTVDLNHLVTLKTGEAADGTRMMGLLNRVADEYGHLGYLDAKITPEPQFNETAHTVAYTVSITEGPEYHMGSLLLTGLSSAGEARVREAWSIKPGTIFDEEFLNEFIETGAKDSFVGIPYTYQKIGHYLEKHAAEGKVDVMIDFQ